MNPVPHSYDASLKVLTLSDGSKLDKFFFFEKTGEFSVYIRAPYIADYLVMFIRGRDKAVVVSETTGESWVVVANGTTSSLF